MPDIRPENNFMSKKDKKKKQKKEEKNDVEAISNGSKQFENLHHETFCILYAGVGTRHFFNNGQNSYLEAYGHSKELNDLEVKLVLETNQKKRKEMSQRKKSLELVARVEGSRLLANPNIRRRVEYLFDQFIDHNVADRELAKTIVQDHDLRSKVDAIKEYNRVRDRVKDNKAAVAVTFSWLGDQKPNAKPSK